MECPKCHFNHPQQTTECLKCGVIFEKYLAFQKAVDDVRDVTPDAASLGPKLTDMQHEFWCRVFAVPGALIFGWFIDKMMPTLGAFLEMWVHECGHTVCAWLYGYPAIPSAWITHYFDRSRGFSLLLGAALIAGAVFAVRLKRWFWVAVCAITLVLLILGNMQRDYDFQVWVAFWGEGGAYILGAVLMMTFYARPSSPITRNQVRWALMIMGAIAFCHVYRHRAGGFQNIVSELDGLDERGITPDAQVMTSMYSWPIYVMIHRYWTLGHWCLAGLATAYAGGLVQAQRWKTALVEELRLARTAEPKPVIGKATGA